MIPAYHPNWHIEYEAIDANRMREDKLRTELAATRYGCTESDSDEDSLRAERDDALMRLHQAEDRIGALEEKIVMLEDEIAGLENEIDSMPAAEDLKEVGTAIRAQDWETAAEFLWRCGVPGF